MEHWGSSLGPFFLKSGSGLVLTAAFRFCEELFESKASMAGYRCPQKCPIFVLVPDLGPGHAAVGLSLGTVPWQRGDSRMDTRSLREKCGAEAYVLTFHKISGRPNLRPCERGWLVEAVARRAGPRVVP